jgi:hypothetical protein
MNFEVREWFVASPYFDEVSILYGYKEIPDQGDKLFSFFYVDKKEGESSVVVAVAWLGMEWEGKRAELWHCVVESDPDPKNIWFITKIS